TALQRRDLREFYYRSGPRVFPLQVKVSVSHAGHLTASDLHSASASVIAPARRHGCRTFRGPARFLSIPAQMGLRVFPGRPMGNGLLISAPRTEKPNWRKLALLQERIRLFARCGASYAGGNFLVAARELDFVPELDRFISDLV